MGANGDNIEKDLEKIVILAGTEDDKPDGELEDLEEYQLQLNNRDEVDNKGMWQYGQKGEIPHNAVYAGCNSYIIRAIHKEQTFIGTLASGDLCGHVPYRQWSHSKYIYQIMVENKQNLEWIWTNGKFLPEGAIIAGEDNATMLFIGRAAIEGRLLIGSYRPDNGLVYLPYRGEVCRVEGCDILCRVDD